MEDHRIAHDDIEGTDEFDRLQALHEAGVGSLIDDQLDELTPGMRALTVLFAFVGDVENGGFEAPMYNQSGRWTGEAIDAAHRVGADEHAEVFEAFADIALRGDLAMGDEAREERLEAMTDEEAEALEALGDRFSELPSLEPVLNAYVDAHPEEFFRD